MDDATTETTTIIIISFLENMLEGKLTNSMHQSGYLPISACTIMKHIKINFRVCHFNDSITLFCTRFADYDLIVSLFLKEIYDLYWLQGFLTVILRIFCVPQVFVVSHHLPPIVFLMILNLPSCSILNKYIAIIITDFIDFHP